MNIDKLAVAANLLGGFDELSNILGVDENLLEKAIGGFTLGSRQSETLTDAFNDAIAENLIDEREVNKLTTSVQSATLRNNTQIKDGFRLAIANGQVDLDELDNYTTLKNLTEAQLEPLIEWLSEDVSRKASEFLDLAFSWDVQESEFWKWFREIFYRE